MPTGQFKTAQAVDQTVVRKANERAVLTHIALHSGVSAADIAKAVGLGPQTVGKIVAELLERGMLERGEVTRGHRGKPATPLSVSSTAAYSIGCEIGWRHCELMLFNVHGVVLGQHRWDLDRFEPSRLLRDIVSVVDLLRRILPQDNQRALTGFALALPADFAARIEMLGGSAREAAAWVDLDLGAQIAQAIDLPVTTLSDGAAACWAQLAAFPRPRPDNFCFIRVSDFISIGFIVNSRLWDPTDREAGFRAGRPAVAPLSIEQVGGVFGLRSKLISAGLATGDQFASDEQSWDRFEPLLSDWLDCATTALASAIQSTAATTGLTDFVIDGVMPPDVLERYVAGTRQQLASLPTPSLRPISVQAGTVGASGPARGAALKDLFRRYYSGEWEHF
jgi:predicted NBD/HSP70 family sugar kinase